MLEHQEAPLHVALYARVSTHQPPQEHPIASQVHLLKHDMQQQGWTLLPDHAYRDAGMRGTWLDRPALARLRDAARCRACDAVVGLAPARLARHSAQHWLLLEEREQRQGHLIFLLNPCGAPPQGTWRTPRQGMLAASARTQLRERTRRGRLAQARRGADVPGASQGYGDRYRPRRHDAPPPVVVHPGEAEVVRPMDRLLVAAHRSCRPLPKRWNEAHLAPPSGPHQVGPPATVSTSLTNRV
jgi:site-specific DNA recombinase